MSNLTDSVTDSAKQVTLESLAARIDTYEAASCQRNESLVARLDAYEAASRQRDDQHGLQMNWLCEKLQGLFYFVDQAGKNGGGIKGMLKTLRSAPPELLSQEVKEVPNE